MQAKGLDHRLRQAGMLFRVAWMGVREGRSVVSAYGERTGRANVQLNELERLQGYRARIDQAYRLLTPAQVRAVVAVCGEDERVGKTNDTLMLGLAKLAAAWVQPIGDAIR